MHVKLHVKLHLKTLFPIDFITMYFLILNALEVEDTYYVYIMTHYWCTGAKLYYLCKKKTLAPQHQ